MSFKDVVIVTGASGGIGSATVAALTSVTGQTIIVDAGQVARWR